MKRKSGENKAWCTFLKINQVNCELASLKIVPMEVENFRLNHASKPDALVLNRDGSKVGTQVKLNEDNSIELEL